MNLKTLNLHQLYRGYVLSFSSNNIPIDWDEDDYNRPLFTHKILSYWSNVGLSLGFYPWCEESQRDLGWYSKENNCILHLESENSSERIEKTITKLAESTEKFKIGIIFVGESSKFEEKDLFDKLSAIKNDEALIITTWWNQESEVIKDQQYNCLVTGHLIKKGIVENLEKAICVWDKYGSLRMIFQDEPN